MIKLKTIATTEGALERLYRTGDKFILSGASINGHSMPRLEFTHAEHGKFMGTIYSNGGKRWHVYVEGGHYLNVMFAPTASDLLQHLPRWTFSNNADGHEKRRIQGKRAFALVCAALEFINS